MQAQRLEHSKDFRNAVPAARQLRTACGGRLIITSKATEHLAAHPEVANILPEAVGRIVLPLGGFMSAEVDFGRVVGRTTLVKTPPCDSNSPMLFAQRVGRVSPSHVVPSDTLGEETAKIVVLAQPSRDQAKTYLLVTSWIGVLADKEPWDRNIRTQNEYDKCVLFWCGHALIHDPAVMGPVYESTWDEVLSDVAAVARN